MERWVFRRFVGVVAVQKHAQEEGRELVDAGGRRRRRRLRDVGSRGRRFAGDRREAERGGVLRGGRGVNVGGWGVAFARRGKGEGGAIVLAGGGLSSGSLTRYAFGPSSNRRFFTGVAPGGGVASREGVVASGLARGGRCASLRARRRARGASAARALIATRRGARRGVSARASFSFPARGGGATTGARARTCPRRTEARRRGGDAARRAARGAPGVAGGSERDHGRARADVGRGGEKVSAETTTPWHSCVFMNTTRR